MEGREIWLAARLMNRMDGKMPATLKNKSLISCAVIAMAMALASCQTVSRAGKEPITISPQVNISFKDYLASPEPRAFAVSADGKVSGSYYCNKANGCPSFDHAQDAIRYCEGYLSKGSSCKIYALENNVAWKGPVKVLAK